MEGNWLIFTNGDKKIAFKVQGVNVMISLDSSTDEHWYQRGFDVRPFLYPHPPALVHHGHPSSSTDFAKSFEKAIQQILNEYTYDMELMGANEAFP